MECAFVVKPAAERADICPATSVRTAWYRSSLARQRHQKSMSALGRGCVKTCMSHGCAELFSLLCPRDGCCEHWRLSYLRNWDGNSTRQNNVRVFTQPGSFSEVGPRDKDVRSTPRSRPRRTTRSVPFSANNGSRV